MTEASCEFNVGLRFQSKPLLANVIPMNRTFILILAMWLTQQVACADEPKDSKPVKEARALIGAFEAFADVVGDLAGALANKNENDVHLNAIAQQFTPQFQHLVKSELYFIRKVCQPSDEQYQTIKAAGDQTLKTVVRRCAEDQLRMQRGNAKESGTDPRQEIAVELSKRVEEVLSVEQLRRYQRELEQRAAARKHAAMLALVAHLDKELVLSGEQRTRLKKSLEAKWNDAWSYSLEAMMYGAQYMPLVPDDVMTPVLNDKQQEIWRQTPKHRNMIWGFAGLGFVQPVDIEDEPEAAAKAPQK